MRRLTRPAMFCAAMIAVCLLNMVDGAEHPNVVVIMADDLGFGDVSCYGAKTFQTPNIDRIAQEGCRFTSGYCSASTCTPTRYSFLTGKYAFRQKGTGIAPPNGPAVIPAGTVTIASLLKDAGYRTAVIGKWHLGLGGAGGPEWNGQLAPGPLEIGFDHCFLLPTTNDRVPQVYVEDHRVLNLDQNDPLWIGDEKPGDDHPTGLTHRSTLKMNWSHGHNSTIHNGISRIGFYTGGTAARFRDEDLADMWVQKSVNWIRRNREQPFFLFFASHDLHVPRAVHERFQGTTPHGPRTDAIAELDWSVGEILKTLDELKLSEKTLVVFCSDNGPVLDDGYQDEAIEKLGEHRPAGPYRGGKYNVFEGGTRTPLITRWPGHIPAGVTSDEIVCTIDFAASVAGLCDISVPENACPDSEDVSGALLARADAKGRESLVQQDNGQAGNFGFRSGQWKLIRCDSGKMNNVGLRLVPTQLPKYQLFDLAEDPGETNNIIDQHPDVAKELIGKLEAIVQAGRRPNIITIFIDDMGWSDLGCFGGTDTSTPNIDQLASEGIRFTNFYVNSPICSPSRTALTTGQYPARHRITSYLSKRAENESRGMAQWLDVQAATLPRALHESGYATVHVGKWHLGGQRDVGEAPLITEYGFDQSLTNFEGLGPRILPLKNAFDGKEAKPHALGSDQLGRGPIEWEDRSRISGRWVDRSIQVLAEASGKGQPVYLNLWPDDVHSPFFPPKSLRGDGEKRTLYCGVLQNLDAELKRLFDYVRNTPALSSNTLILLASDNGPEPGAGQSQTLRGHKGELWEGGIRSPLIVWGPGLLEPGSIGKTNSETVISSVDLVASLTELTGVKFPAGYQSDGENLLGAMLGKTHANRSQPLFWRRPPDRPSTADRRRPDLAVRDGQWKCVCNLDGSNPELYNLIEDPSEQFNVADKRPRITTRLVAAMLNWNEHLPVDGVRSASLETREIEENQFINPIAEGADPWVVRDPFHERYLWCMSDGNRGIALWSSSTLTSLGERHLIWQAPETGPNSREVWAPELHQIGEHWYVYFAASDGRNDNHLAWVLKSKTTDALGEWDLHGPFATGDGTDGMSPNVWAIDMTVLEYQGKLYAIWSGWDAPGTDQQFLYIAPMKNPTELAGPRVRLCSNSDFLWERTEERTDSRGLHEGPQVLKRGTRTFLTYSTAASWLPTYKLGMLELTGDNPLDPASWKKFDKPVFQSTETVYGVGHSCFVNAGDDQWWHIFHAKQDRNPGWRRAIHVEPFRFKADGTPDFGQPQAAGQPIPKPPDLRKGEIRTPFHRNLRTPESLSSWNYIGHHQLMRQDADGLHLGVQPETPINVYRCGEKLLTNSSPMTDFEVSVSLQFIDGARDAGLLFRTTGASVGYDAQRGYFAGLVPGTQLLIVGRMDGTSWKELRRESIPIDLSQTYRLTVRCLGDQISVSVNDETRLELTDSTWKSGLAGLRVVETHAVFTDFELKPLP